MAEGAASAAGRAGSAPPGAAAALPRCDAALAFRGRKVQHQPTRGVGVGPFDGNLCRRAIVDAGQTGIDQPFAAPQYDTVAIDAALAAGKLPLKATLGAAEEVAVVPVEPPWLARLLSNPWLIGGTILLLAVLLGFSLFVAAKRLDTKE